MISDDTATFLATGCALIVGAVTPDGSPFAARGWGLDLEIPDDTGTSPIARLLLDASDTTACTSLGTGTAISITATSVPTLRSVQLKGRVREVIDAGDHDRARAARYCAMFEDDVVATDGVDREVFRHIVPDAYCVRVVDLEEVYDQTPGPGAGAALGRPT